MLDSVIKKLSLILVLCGGIACIIYFTDLGAILKGEAEEKVKQKVKTGLGEDDAKREEEKIQRITNESIEKVNSILATKEQEIMEI